MTKTHLLCGSPHPTDPGVLCVGPSGHRVTNTMHGNGDLRWWDGAQPDAGTENDGAAYASPELAWLEQRRGQEIEVTTGFRPRIGVLDRVMVEPDADSVMHPTALVLIREDRAEMLVPWLSVEAVSLP